MMRDHSKRTHCRSLKSNQIANCNLSEEAPGLMPAGLESPCADQELLWLRPDSRAGLIRVDRLPFLHLLKRLFNLQKFSGHR